MTLAVEILADADDVAARAAEEVASLAGERVAAPLGERTFTFAVSGGRTPWTMFEAMAQVDMPWDALRFFQVDERIAPPGDPERNLTHLLDALPPGRSAQVLAMFFEGASGTLNFLVTVNFLTGGFDLTAVGKIDY